MKLVDLVKELDYTLRQGSLSTEVNGIYYDSRKVQKGGLFVCITGTQRDSHDLARECAEKGASVIVIQREIQLEPLGGVTILQVDKSRKALAILSAAFFGWPARKMTMIGVTGTKGKTTTTHLIKGVLEAAGRKVGMIGTNGVSYGDVHQETINTTPESYELQRIFSQMLEAGCDTVVMEVSSQGLMLDRVAGIRFDVGVFTNLSPDHIGPGEH